MKNLLARRDFRVLFAGLLSSMIGDSVMLIVLAIWVKDLTGSNGKAGLTIFFLVAPALVAPLLGWVVDLFRRRPFLIAANLLSAVALVPLLFVHDAGDVWIIYSVAALYGVSFVVIPAALSGLLKEMLPEDLLVDANGSLQTVRESLRLFGPLLGAGLLTAFGGGTVAIIDAATFCVAALFIALVPVREEKPAPPELHLWGEVSVGVRHVWRDALLRPTLLALGGVLLVFGFLESLSFAIVDAFDKTPSFVGVVISVQGVGAVAGGIASARIVRRVGEVPAIVGSLAVAAAGVSLWLAPVLAVVLTGAAVFGAGLPVLMVAGMTLMQRRTPARIMGRVSAAADVVLGAPQTVSIAVGAVLVGILDYRYLVGIIAAATVLGAIGLWTSTRRARAGLAAPVESELDAALEAAVASAEVAEPGLTPVVREATP
jgi:MFS family permease